MDRRHLRAWSQGPARIPNRIGRDELRQRIAESHGCSSWEEFTRQREAGPTPDARVRALRESPDLAERIEARQQELRRMRRLEDE